MVPSISVTKGRLALVVACLLALVVGVQLADPAESSVARPVGDPPDESRPADLLRHSIARLNATAYTLTVSVNDSGSRERVWHSKVNYTEQETSLELGADDAATRLYFHSDGGWVKHPTYDWRHGGVFDRTNQFGRATVPVPYRSGTIRADSTRIHNRTDDALWIRVDGKRQNAITNPSAPGDAYTLYELDSDTYRLRSSVEYASATDAVRNVYVFEKYGRTTVPRPSGTRDLPVNLLSDLLR